MRKQQREIKRLLFEFLEQRLSEMPQAGSGIEDDDVALGADFDTGGIATISDCVRPRRGNGSADAPESDLRGAFDGATLMQVASKIKSKTDEKLACPSNPPLGWRQRWNSENSSHPGVKSFPPSSCSYWSSASIPAPCKMVS
jgi:hypothetical protein